MKSSQYNLFVQREDAVWAFNTLSTALVRFTPPQYQLAQQILSGQLGGDESPVVRETYLGLVRGRFLIPDETDEYKMLKIKNHVTRFRATGVGLVIAPTLRCNFRCPYCYVDLNANKMSPPDRAKVKKFFARKLPDDGAASVCWTGGDPSLALDVVEDLSREFIRLCGEKGARYDSVMISNAYLLDRRMLDTLRRCRIHSLQVTLDGGREYHDATRALANGSSSYDRILDNVAAACEEITINLRVNVDSRNQGSIPGVLDDLIEHGLAGKVAVYFAHVEAVNQQSEGYRSHCLNTDEYAVLEPQLLKAALARGLQISGRVMGRPIGSFCGANSCNHFVIDPGARLLKCYEDLGTAERNGIGYIDEEGNEVITLRDNFVSWLGWDPFENEECRTCRVLPLCMGGCSYHSIRSGLAIGPGCLKLRYNADEIIPLYGERLAQQRAGNGGTCGTCQAVACSHT